jgi:hypothetical protein
MAERPNISNRSPPQISHRGGNIAAPNYSNLHQVEQCLICRDTPFPEIILSPRSFLSFTQGEIVLDLSFARPILPIALFEDFT